MKTSLSSLFLMAVGSFVFALGSASADNLYFRPAPDGGDPVGGIPQTGETYTWDTSMENWFTAKTGGTKVAWDNDASNVAYISKDNAPYAIQLAQDIILSGIRYFGDLSGSPSNRPLITSQDKSEPSTLTFETGSTISYQNGRVMAMDNIKIKGKFSLVGGYLALGDGIDFLSETQITVSGTGDRLGLYITGMTNANVVLDNRSISLDTGTNSTGSLSRLSGVGNISRSASGGTLILDQNDNTVLEGKFINTNFSFTKDGTGTFILDANNEAHTFNSTLKVDKGAFYTNGSLASFSNFTIANNAVVGGTFTTNTLLTLTGSGSTILPGMATLDAFDNVENHVGTIELGKGLKALSGGTFDFYLDESAADLISIIKVTEGTVSLDGEITVNLYGLGAGELLENVVYTLFDASGATSFTSTATWRLGDNTTGLEIYSYGFNESTKQFQVTFGVIPEPSSTLLLLGGGLLALLVCRHGLRRSARTP